MKYIKMDEHFPKANMQDVFQGVIDKFHKDAGKKHQLENGTIYLELHGRILMIFADSVIYSDSWMTIDQSLNQSTVQYFHKDNCAMFIQGGKTELKDSLKLFNINL